MKRLRVAILCDYPEEGWPSMDLTAEMVLSYLNKGHASEIEAVRICPPFRHRFGPMPIHALTGARRNLDRVLNRYRDYPKYLRGLVRREQFDIYHVIDHSYAQLVHAVPPGKAVVTCHDLDTFRCLLRPELEPRPAWFRGLTRRTLRGLQTAAAISCDSEATRSAILEHHLVPPERLTMNHLGTNPEFVAEPVPENDAELDCLIGPPDPMGPIDLLHVGSNIARKRIDVLLATFAAVRRAIPRARLIKVGGEFTPTQAAQASDLEITDAILSLPFLTNRLTLAALYRRAALVLQPSDAEGFGFPLVEAMSCGAPLLVSDIPVLREVAGEAAVYQPVGDVASWTQAVISLVEDCATHSQAWQARRSAGFLRSATYRWENHTSRLVEIYRNVAR